MNDIQFVRFQCDAGHISAFRFASEDVRLDHGPACGDTGIQQIESEYVEADITADTSLLEVSD